MVYVHFHYTKDLKKEKIKKSFTRPKTLKFPLFTAKIRRILAERKAPARQRRAGAKVKSREKKIQFLLKNRGLYRPNWLHELNPFKLSPLFYQT